MRYRVRAVQREGFDGRHRSGRHFSSAHWTILEEGEVTPEILADPLLIVEPDTPVEDAPDPVEAVRSELQASLDEAVTTVVVLREVVDALKSEVALSAADQDALRARVTELQAENDQLGSELAQVTVDRGALLQRVADLEAENEQLRAAAAAKSAKKG